MKIIYCLLFVFVFNSTAFGQNEVKLLNKAYKKQSVELLKEFFENWYNKNPTISKLELDTLATLEKEAYNVFTSIYTPIELDSSVNKSIPSFYTNIKYFIIQNRISISVVDQLDYSKEQVDSIIWNNAKLNSQKDSMIMKKFLTGNKKQGRMFDRWYTMYYLDFIDKKAILLGDTINNFKPFIKYSNVKPLYINSNYIKIIETFLGKIFFDKNIASSKKLQNEKRISLEKLKFLNSISKGIFYGCFTGDCYRFIWGPSVKSITFDKNIRFARAYYWTNSDSQYLVQLRKNSIGKWEIVSRDLTAEI